MAWPQQSSATLQLAIPIQVRGVVVDSAGNPIPDVRIDHIALTEDFAKADSLGHFEFEAGGPSVVFRKIGWDSRLVRVSNLGNDARVELERRAETEPLPVCSKKAHCVTTEGIFCLPKIRGVNIGDRPFTIDAFEREFTISSWSGRRKTMVHGTGTSWGGPAPRTREIWDSVEFSESQRDLRGQLVFDARGKTRDGKFWRSIGQSDETLFYYRQDQKDAMLFDRVMDGLCVSFVPDR